MNSEENIKLLEISYRAEDNTPVIKFAENEENARVAPYVVGEMIATDDALLQFMQKAWVYAVARRPDYKEVMARIDDDIEQTRTVLEDKFWKEHPEAKINN